MSVDSRKDRAGLLEDTHALTILSQSPTHPLSGLDDLTKQLVGASVGGKHFGFESAQLVSRPVRLSRDEAFAEQMRGLQRTLGILRLLRSLCSTQLFARRSMLSVRPSVSVVSRSVKL
jgi:hypothetical protein